MNIIKKLPPLALLLGAVTLLQIHGIQFWQTYAHGSLTIGSITLHEAWLWSGVLHIGSLYLWAQRGWLTLPALVLTCIVLAAPLYQLSAPAIAQYQVSNSQPAALEKSEAALLMQRDTLNQNIKELTADKWHSEARKVRAELNSVNTQLNDLYQQQATPEKMAWLSLAVVAVQMLALVMLEILSIHCARVISSKSSPINNDEEKEQPLADNVKQGPWRKPKDSSQQSKTIAAS